MYTSPPTIHPDDIVSVTEFIRNAPAFTKRIKKSKNPAVLTVNGRAELIVMNKAQYNGFIQAQQDFADQMAIQAGLDDIAAGRTRPAQEVFDELNMKYLGKKLLRTKKKLSPKKKNGINK